jgi:hypothetical protein
LVAAGQAVKELAPLAQMEATLYSARLHLLAVDMVRQKVLVEMELTEALAVVVMVMFRAGMTLVAWVTRHRHLQAKGIMEETAQHLDQPIQPEAAAAQGEQEHLEQYRRCKLVMAAMVHLHQ